MSVNFYEGRQTVGIWGTDEFGDANLVKCLVADIPSAVPGYARGCDLTASDTGAHYFNVGTSLSCTFAIVSGTTVVPGGITLLSGRIIVGNGANVGQSRTMTGDGTLSNTGVLTVTKINGVTVTSTATNAHMLVADGAQWNSVALTGDVGITNAGVTSVTGIYGNPISAAFTVNASFLLYNSGAVTLDPVIMSGDATMTNAGVVVVTKSTGTFTVGGRFAGTITSSSGPGAVAITGMQHQITTTGIGDALTLANGLVGQRLSIIYVAESAGADTAVLTPTTLAGTWTTITFAAIGDSVDLVYSAISGWNVVGVFGAVVA